MLRRLALPLIFAVSTATALAGCGDDDFGQDRPIHDLSVQVVDGPDMATIVADLTAFPDLTPIPDLTIPPCPDLLPTVALPVHCSDTFKDSNETDVDCGGPACSPCATGKSCNGAADCASASCTNLKCDPPSCGDGIKDGEETDVDCGGTMCGKCALWKLCLVNDDCDSLTCIGCHCIGPSCTNGNQDGRETDVDCGGGVCPQCAFGMMCKVGSDCVSGVCKAIGLGPLLCQSSCTDKVKDGTETDVDCGGGNNTCPRCAGGLMCRIGTDCASGVCHNNACAGVPDMTMPIDQASPNG